MAPRRALVVKRAQEWQISTSVDRPTLQRQKVAAAVQHRVQGAPCACGACRAQKAGFFYNG